MLAPAVSSQALSRAFAVTDRRVEERTRTTPLPTSAQSSRRGPRSLACLLHHLTRAGLENLAMICNTVDMTDFDPATSLQARTRWPRPMPEHTEVVNQIALSEAPPNGDGTRDGGMYLILGHVLPPMFTGQDDVDEFVASGGVLDIQPKGAFYLSTPRALELYRMLGAQLGLPTDQRHP